MSPRPAPTPRRPTASSVDRPVPAEFEELERLARLLDSRWSIPGTGIRFGVDAVAGLLPGVGDAAAALVSAYIILHARRLGAPNGLQARMVSNVALDTIVGSVPVLGSVFDLFYKANNRNIALLRRHLHERHARKLSEES
jgi:hypothetical protein